MLSPSWLRIAELKKKLIYTLAWLTISLKLHKNIFGIQESSKEEQKTIYARYILSKYILIFLSK